MRLRYPNLFRISNLDSRVSRVAGEAAERVNLISIGDAGFIKARLQEDYRLLEGFSLDGKGMAILATVAHDRDEAAEW